MKAKGVASMPSQGINQDIWYKKLITMGKNAPTINNLV